MSSVISDRHFHDERAAYAYVEARIWPNGPTCPHCGNADAKRIRLMEGKSTRIGVRQCNECRKPFTVKVGTIFESSHVPLRLWLQAIHLVCSSKKGISANQLHRILGVTLKTAWFMGHRIREAMRDGGLSHIGGEGQTVEIDETVFGKQEGAPKNASFKAPISAISLLPSLSAVARRAASMSTALRLPTCSLSSAPTSRPRPRS